MTNTEEMKEVAEDASRYYRGVQTLSVCMIVITLVLCLSLFTDVFPSVMGDTVVVGLADGVIFCLLSLTLMRYIQTHARLRGLMQKSLPEPPTN